MTVGIDGLVGSLPPEAFEGADPSMDTMPMVSDAAPPVPMIPPMSGAGVGFPSTDPQYIAQVVAQVLQQIADADHQALAAQQAQAQSQVDPIVQALMGGMGAGLPPEDPSAAFGEGAALPPNPDLAY